MSYFNLKIFIGDLIIQSGHFLLTSLFSKCLQTFDSDTLLSIKILRGAQSQGTTHCTRDGGSVAMLMPGQQTIGNFEIWPGCMRLGSPH